MPRLICVHLRAAQRKELFERQRRQPVVSRLWRRLEMVRQADWGKRAPAIAEWVGLHVQTVRAYLKAFQVSGFAGLVDRPRSGRPPRLGAADWAAVEALLDRAAAGERTWTLRQLTAWLARERGVAISASRLSRLLRLRRFRWKRTKHSLQHKADPLRQAAKTADLRTLETYAEAGIMDLHYLDESGFAPSGPLSYTWAREGTRPLLRYEAPRDRRVNVLGAWAPLGDRPAYTAATTTGKITTDLVLDFLWRELGGLTTPVGELPEGFVRDRPLVVVLDNASAHTSTVFKAHRDRLAAADLHLFYLPTYSPHLNRIEARWRQLKYQDLPVRSYPTLAALLHAVRDALDHYVRNPSLCPVNLRASA